jgi:hypothetical protein
MANCCEHNDETSVHINGEKFLDKLSNYHLLLLLLLLLALPSVMNRDPFQDCSPLVPSL